MHITHIQLFQTTKIQTFERAMPTQTPTPPQRLVVSDYKDTNF